ncbi:ADP-ribosylation factor-like protein [Capnocytophaga leadbetteri]
MITIAVLPLFFWFLLPLLGGLVGGGLAAAVVAIGESLSRIAKRFTILGERASGKTTLHHFLTTGQVYMGEYKQTSREKTAKNLLKLKDLELIVNESVDIGGAEVMRGQWEKLINESDVICYLIRGDKVFEGDRKYIDLIKEHISQILNTEKAVQNSNTEKAVQNSNTEKAVQKLYLLITFLDIIPQYSEDADMVKKQIDETLKISVFKKGTKAIYGSLKTQEETEQLVYELITDILENSKK